MSRLAWAELQLWITFDRALPWQLGMTFGADWTRVAVNIPAKACEAGSATETELSRYVHAALEALAAIAPSSYLMKVDVGGPDVPANARELGRWCEAYCVARLDRPVAAGAPLGGASGAEHAPLSGENINDPRRQHEAGPWQIPAASAAPQAPSRQPQERQPQERQPQERQPQERQPQERQPQERHPQETLIQQMVQTVRRHMMARGSAPSFQQDNPAAVGRAHNYIRSVSAAQAAPSDVVEEVRRRLAP